MDTPTIIQGGMGAGVSSWRLARAVSERGHLGVVAGTALDVILVRRLQLGDPGGHMRRALAHFPVPEVARGILARFFRAGGKSREEAFQGLPLAGAELGRERCDLIVAANFVEVWLAREGHSGSVGINYLEKIQFPTLPSLFGAMLAGVTHVLMGAGIPTAIPGILDRLAAGLPAQLDLSVLGAERKFQLAFDPAPYLEGAAVELGRPAFLAIVSSHTVASVMVRKASGRTDGLVVEGNLAGGHNAPPRGRMEKDERGEPVYGARDLPDVDAIAALGVPFWLAGSCASPVRLAEARARGAAGIQVGTAFAFCEESGLDPVLRRHAIDAMRRGDAAVFTDPVASPTGFPFKVLELSGTLADDELSRDRRRICDLGYLRQAYQRPDGSLGWRCPGEPVGIFVQKGGRLSETLGRKCVCNGLMANIGMAQRQKGGSEELPLLTCGADLDVVETMMAAHPGGYRAEDVLDYLLTPVPG